MRVNDVFETPFGLYRITAITEKYSRCLIYSKNNKAIEERFVPNRYLEKNHYYKGHAKNPLKKIWEIGVTKR